MSHRSDLPPKIRWAPRLPPELLGRLYASDARQVEDMELCDEVGMYLYSRCRTFFLTNRGEVECPRCHEVFAVARQGTTVCPKSGCGWSTTRLMYEQSMRNHYAYTGRGVAAFVSYYQEYPAARTYKEKLILIDRLIHDFHWDEAKGIPTKSVASKLLEGNKKEVVRFLDRLSAIDQDAKNEWRRIVAATIDGRVIGRGKD